MFRSPQKGFPIFFRSQAKRPDDEDPLEKGPSICFSRNSIVRILARLLRTRTSACSSVAAAGGLSTFCSRPGPPLQDEKSPIPKPKTIPHCPWSRVLHHLLLVWPYPLLHFAAVCLSRRFQALPPQRVRTRRQSESMASKALNAEIRQNDCRVVTS